MQSLNFIDIIVLIIFACSILFGLARGLISEVLSLATLVIAFLVAATFSSALATAITNTSVVQSLMSQATSATGINTAKPETYVALAISFGVLFAGTVIVGSIVKSLVNIAFQTGLLGLGNRLLGGVFGFAKGFLLNLVLIFIVQLTPLNAESWWQQSYFVHAFQPGVQWLGNIVSPALANLKAEAGQTLQSVTSQFQNATQSVSQKL